MLKLKKFLDTHKPFFIYENQKYFIEDIASYHIHAGDYFIKNRPSGAHSNSGGNKLDYFNPTLVKDGLQGTKKVFLHNSRFENQSKPSTTYSEKWSEYYCDLKAIEALMNDKVIIKKSENGSTLEILAYTTEDLEIRIFYDIVQKRIKSHYPSLEKI